MVVLSSFSPPTEGIVHSENRTQAHVGGHGGTSFGNGTLFIAESRISWIDEEGKGFALEYPAVSLHAVCRDLNAFPHECLYLMIDAKLHDQGEQDGSSSSDDEDSPKISEIRFVPENKDSLQVMYKAMSDCQALHPDEDDSISEEEEEALEDYSDYSEGGYFTSEQDIEHLNPQGQATLQRLEAMLQSNTIQGENRTPNGTAGGGGEPMETGQFEDADDIQ